MDHHIYKRNFIKSVIFRLDFPIPIQSLDALEKPIDFQRAILKSFPILEEAKLLKQEVQVTQDGVSSVQKDAILYKFWNTDRTCQLGFESRFMFIEHTRYDGYENFVKLVDSSVDSLFSQWPDTTINRLGLRYENDINIPNPSDFLDWSKYISPKILSAQDLYCSHEQLTRFVVHTELRTDDYFGRVVTGMPNPDYPGRIRQRQFVIDIDLYTNEAVNKQDIRPKLDLYHDATIRYFETSIAKPLRDYMDAETNA